MKRWKLILLVFIIILSNGEVFSQSSDFFAYYTRLDFEDENNTGKYADIVIQINNSGRVIFSREYSYLPYWETKSSKQFFDRIIPFKGDGTSERPDRVNKCSYVRIVENSGD